MMRSLYPLAGSALLAGCVLGSSTRGASSRLCPSPSAAALTEVADFRTMLADSDSVRVDYRDSLGISGVSPRSVETVTDAAVCTAVTNAVRAYMHQSTARTGNLYVLRVGSRYLAIDPTSEDAAQWILTRDFVVQKYLLP